jgi:hypothetical protein
VGQSGNTEVILAAAGTPVTCTVIDADTKTSAVNGVPVSAGYFVTNKNGHGIRNIIYFASFKLNDISVYYVELGDVQSESDTLREEITSVIDKLTQNGSPDLSKIIM